MDIEVAKSSKSGFMLTEQELRRIYDTLMKQMWYITTDDDISSRIIIKSFDLRHKNPAITEKTTVDEVFSEDNGDNWIITEILIAIASKSQPKAASVSLKFRKFISKNELSIIYAILSNNRDWSYLTSSLLDDRIAKVKRVHIDNIGIVIFIFALVLPVVVLPLKLPLGDSLLAFFMLIMLAVSGITCALCFPSDNFYWGDYIKVFDKKQSTGKWIIISVVLTTLLGIIGSIVGNYLTLRTGISH
jgi:hypothetical protein